MAETNRFAANSAHIPRTRGWYDVTVNEMKAFIGILLTMGILKLPRLELYWTMKYPWIRTPGISNVMSKTRFEQLFRFLHLNDNSLQKPVSHPQHCRLFKVKKMLDMIQPLFYFEYRMQQQCNIDESMIPFKGRLRFKQYEGQTNKVGCESLGAC